MFLRREHYRMVTAHGCGVPWGWLQVRLMVVACPAILAEKPLELQRKVDFLKQVSRCRAGVA